LLGAKSRLAAITGLVLVTSLTAFGCGSNGGGGGTATLNWYVFKEPGGAYDKAVADCNKQANGRYEIKYQALPTNANQQRELLVRRLAAKDSSVDLAGMDVIWTAEFAAAGWIKPWTGANAAAAREDKLEGPLKTVDYRGQIWAIPFTSNTQLLWYRKDEVPNPGEDATWDEIIKIAHDKGKAIEEQGNQYEGLTVWINSLVAGAGTPLVSQSGKVTASDAAIKDAATIEKRLATEAAPAGLATNQEDQARLGFEAGRSVYELNYTFIWPSAAAIKGFQKKIGWARYPRTVPDKPSRPPLGGINIGVGSYTNHTKLAFEAARCLASDKNQAIASELGGLPPTTESVYNDPKVKKAFPFADELRTSIESAAPRSVTAAYADISLAIQKTFHPPSDVNPDDVVSKLKDRLDKAAEGKIF
jgi:multiple sugar transport system substrate-binding protein